MYSGLKNVLIALKKGFQLLQHKDPLILSSSTAFFATFSLSPILVILVSIFGLYAGTRNISNQLFRTFSATFGRQTAKDIETIVNNFLSIEGNWWITLGSLVFFVFVSTTLMGVIKFAIQKIWHIRAKPNLKLLYHSKARGTQLGLILFTGVLFAVSFYIDTSLGVSLDYLQSVWHEYAIIVIRTLSALFSLIVITIWFTTLFKFLPEASVPWDTAFTGGFLTGVLFSLGKLVLGEILVHARLADIFGASASFALLLLFIFYCSFILYYGAAFTREYSDLEDNKICAGRYSDEYEERVIGQNPPSQVYPRKGISESA